MSGDQEQEWQKLGEEAMNIRKDWHTRVGRDEDVVCQGVDGAHVWGLGGWESRKCRNIDRCEIA